MKSSDIEMKERTKLLGSTTTLTYHSRATTELELEGQAGRFRNQTVVTGATPSAQWPAMPDNSPWAVAADAPGVEPPTGYSIEEMEVCGETFEVQQSMKANELASLVSSSVRDATPATAVAPLPTGTAPLSSRGSGATLQRRRFA
jgi:hypothetical protein